MPTYQWRPLTVTLTVEIDGHTLTFQQKGEAKGCFFSGDKPVHDWNDVIEQDIRCKVSEAVTLAAADVDRFMARAYPVHSDHPNGR